MEDRRMGDVKIEVLTTKVEHWMETTTEYRKSLCTKIDGTNARIDALVEKMNGLPCRERIEASKGVRLQLKALWILVSGALLGIISEWVKIK